MVTIAIVTMIIRVVSIGKCAYAWSASRPWRMGAEADANAGAEAEADTEAESEVRVDASKGRR